MEIDMVNETSLRRRLLFDSMADPAAACALLGLPGMSEEGLQMEQADSRHRLAAISHLMPGLQLFAQWTAEAALAYQVDLNGENDLPPDFQEQMLEMFNSVAPAAIVASVSVLNDLGAVIVAPEVGNG